MCELYTQVPFSRHSVSSLLIGKEFFSNAGGETFFPSPYRYVDIRDVANAHIQALELPTASSRYLLVGSIIQRCDILKFLRENYLTLLPPGKYVSVQFFFNCFLLPPR